MKYVCEKCHYNTNNVTNYKKHLNTKKHLDNKDVTVDLTQYECKVCNLKYNNRMSLWRHKKKCIDAEEPNVTINIKDNSVLNGEIGNNFELMNQTIISNQAVLTELVKSLVSIVEQLKQPQAQITGDNNVNANNNNTTVLMMLNTNYSHVMSMDTFIKNIEVSLERMLSSLDKEMPEVTKDIFMDNLAGISPEDRPIHCSDSKRNTYYVKGPEEWVKDQGEKLIKAIDVIQKLNVFKLMDWKEENSYNIDNNDRIGDEYFKMFGKITGDDIERTKIQAIKLINEIIPLKDIK